MTTKSRSWAKKFHFSAIPPEKSLPLLIAATNHLAAISMVSLEQPLANFTRFIVFDDDFRLAIRQCLTLYQRVELVKRS